MLALRPAEFEEKYINLVEIIVTAAYCFVVLINNSEFTQQDGRKKRTAKRLCVTNLTRPLLPCFVVIFTNIDVFWSFTKKSV